MKPQIPRRWLAIALTLLLLTGCARGEAEPVTANPDPKPPVTSGPKLTDPTTALPTPDQEAPEGPLCGLAQAYENIPEDRVQIYSAPWVYLKIGGDCRVEVPVGKTSLLLFGAWADAVAQVQPGTWESGGYRIDLNVQVGQWDTIEIPSVARLIVQAVPELAFSLEAAEGENGPWRPLRTHGIIKPSERWLRLTMHRSVSEEEALGLVKAGRYGSEPLQAEVTRLADGVYLFHLGTEQPVLDVRVLSNFDHLAAAGSADGYLYRAEMPKLLTWTAAAGERMVLGLQEEPYYLQLAGTQLRYFDQAYSRYVGVDVVTGAVDRGGPTEPGKTGGDPGPLALVYSPNGRLAAGGERNQGQLGARTVDLVLEDWRDGWSQRVVGSLNLPPVMGCTRQNPDIAWRFDNGAFAVLSQRGGDETELLVYDVARERLTPMQSWHRAMSAFSRMSWSGDGQYIAAGPYLVAASTGDTVREDLMEHVYWSPDGRYLLMMEQFHPFTQWGHMAMIDLISGEWRDLGVGQAAGWTPGGEAVYITWPFAEAIPAPGKGCLP